MEKPVLVSGIQPSGALHIGNYLGALKNFVELQNSGKYQCYFFLADLHSLTSTEAFTPKEKINQIIDLYLTYLAVGLDPKKSIIFLQSQTSAPSELAWILNTITPFGDLRRMTQFKDKIENSNFVQGVKKFESEVLGETANDPSLLAMGEFIINTGLFTYPTLMAADILIYDAKFIPVGDDQLQHLELTRTLARKFNSRFSETFIEPKDLLTQTPRLMSLDDPTKKMSKSRPAGCLFLDDTPEAIEQKIKRATTDSGSEVKYDKENKPGVSNLMLILSSFSGKSLAQIEKDFAGKNYGEFKKEVIKVTSEYLAPIREKKLKLQKQWSTPIGKKKLKSILASGNKKARTVSDKKIKEVKEKLGLII